jgi:hypothetical protein
MPLVTKKKRFTFEFLVGLPRTFPKEKAGDFASRSVMGMLFSYSVEEDVLAEAPLPF